MISDLLTLFGFALALTGATGTGWLARGWYAGRRLRELQARQAARAMPIRIYEDDDRTPVGGVPIDTLVQSFRTDEFES